MSIKNELQIIIKKSLDATIPDNKIKKEDIVIETPKISTNGDYATNIALTLSKQLKKNPIEISQLLVEQIKDEAIEKAVVAPPGFINIYLSKSKLYNELNKIITENKNYGKSNIGLSKKINIEYVSANPTGTLHIGHGRGATYGDNLSKIMSFCGYDVTREYYINDAGNQMNNLGISIKERYKELCGLECKIPEDGYHGKEIIEIAKSIYEEQQDKLLNKSNEYFRQAGLKILLDQIKKDLDTFRVNFDVFTSEKSLYEKGAVENVLNKLQKKNECYIEENALWLKTSSYGDEKDRVLIKSDGNYTYFLPDIAYHNDKINRGYDEIIDVLGADHHGYINRLKAAIEILGYDSNIIDIKILQMVRLLKDGEEIKISKRTGKTITLNELIAEVGINATRYFFASKSLDTQMDFDLSLAIKNSNENPVYYIEYANARICSILKNYKEDLKLKDNYETITEPLAYNIMNKLLSFTDTIISASNKREPHLICNYVYELSTLFHSYYGKEKFITENKKFTQERMVLLTAIKIVINNALNLLGIIPREEM